MRTLIVALTVALLSPAALRAETLYFIHVDHLGTPRLAIGEDGVERWRWDQLEPFGDNVPIETMGTEGYPINLPLRFPGQYADKETNLAYNMARDYDPAIGRYVQSDPIGLDGGINTYAYVAGIPLEFVDAQGLAKHAPDSAHCRDLRRTIENVRRDIARTESDIANNPQNLPQRIGPGERLAETVRGHQTLVTMYRRNLRRLEDKYDEECGDCEQCSATAPVAVSASVGNEKSNASTTRSVAVVVGTVGAAYVTYRCLRMAPSLLPPLWWTIPANVAVP